MPNPFTLSTYDGMHATVMGLGRFAGGVAAARFLTQHGAVVTVTDLRSAQDLAGSIEMLSDLPIARFALDGHPDDVLSDCQLLVVNPAVRPDHPLVALAESRQIDVTTEIELFLRHCPAFVIAVTGSNGKSTTTALIHHLLLHANPDFEGHVWLGGNIGISLLEQVHRIQPQDIVVLELSSFQLHLLGKKGFRPNIAVLTNFSPNHLDWHGSEADYRKAKQAIFDAQTSDDAAIIPDDTNPGSHPNHIPWRVRGGRLRFGLTDHGDDGAFLGRGMLILRSHVYEDAIRFTVPPQLPGQHNQLNVAAAACAAWLAGANSIQFSAALQTFRALPHRLQLVAEHAGRQFWNDSIATTPESATMALHVFPGRIILLAGGYDKGQDLSAFAFEIRSRVAAAVLMGQTAHKLHELLMRESVDLPSDERESEAAARLQTPGKHGSAGASPSQQPTTQIASELQIRIASDFREAFRSAVAFSQPGDIVLLSPGCASYGWFQDFRERGDLFSALARDWSPDT